MENILTTELAASILGVSQVRVRKLIKEGRLPAEKRGRDLLIQESDVQCFKLNGRKNIGRPSEKAFSSETMVKDDPAPSLSRQKSIEIGNGKIHQGDALAILSSLPSNEFQMIIADPPYFQVLLEEEWDNCWQSSEEYLQWTLEWVKQCKRVLREDGLLYIFGQLGKREHIWLHACSMLTKEMQFHDMIIWDRAVGYNERYDSFTPQYEMVLVLRQTADSKPYFDKDSVRLPYSKEKIQSYLRDNRYKDKQERKRHLRKGKYATNILRVPSLKGLSKEKIGHPSQKPITLINHLISASTKRGDLILDPFLGSGTTAASAQQLGRNWVGIESNSSYVELAYKRISGMIASPGFNPC